MTADHPLHIPEQITKTLPKFLPLLMKAHPRQDQDTILAHVGPSITPVMTAIHMAAVTAALAEVVEVVGVVAEGGADHVAADAVEAALLMG